MFVKTGLNGMTLTITAPNNQYFKGNDSIEIENITSNGIEQDKYTGTLNELRNFLNKL